MLRYRLMILLGIFWVTLILNVERPNAILDLGKVNIADFVYLLGSLSAVIIITIPRVASISRQRLFLFILALYAVGKIITVNIQPSDTQAQVVSSLVIELTILYVGVWLFQTIAESLSQISDVLEGILISKHNYRTVLINNS